MQIMQRSVFDRLKPLESTSGSKPMDLSGACSPGLTDDLQELSFTNKSNQDGSTDVACAKPSISFACLIAMAILDSEHKRLTVSEVYEWMKKTYPYFNSPVAGTGWKNSVRHNLSLNKHFVKQVRDDGEPGGKGSYWRIRPESMPTMEITIRKQGGGQLTRQLDDMLSQSPMMNGNTSNSNNNSNSINNNSHNNSNSSSPKSPTEHLFTQSITLPRRNTVSRPKPQASRRLRSLSTVDASTSSSTSSLPMNNNPTNNYNLTANHNNNNNHNGNNMASTMDDHEAAAMLCSFSSSSEPPSPSPTMDDSSNSSPCHTTSPISPTPQYSSSTMQRGSSSKRQVAFPSLWKAAQEGRAIATEKSNKRRNPSFKATFNPNAHKSDMTSVKTLAYVPKRPRRVSLSSSSTLPSSTPTTNHHSSSMQVDDNMQVAVEETLRSPSNTNLAQTSDHHMSNQSGISAERPFFTFSAPLSMSRYTPEGPTARTPHHDEKSGAFSPPKIRRKLGLNPDINVKMQETTDVVAAALLGLSSNPYSQTSASFVR